MKKSCFLLCAFLTAILISFSPAMLAEEPAPAGQKELPDAVKGLKAKIYNLSEAGLKTLEASIESPFLKDNPLFQGAKLKLYFKSPGMQELDVEGVDQEMKTLFLAMFKDTVEFMRYLFCMGPLIDYICACELIVTNEVFEKIGPVVKITAKPIPSGKEKPQTSEDKGAEKPAKEEKGSNGSKEEALDEAQEWKLSFKDMGVITIWADKELKPIRMARNLDGNETVMDLEVVDKDGKLLISKILLKRKDSAGNEQKTTISIAYEKIKNLWLPAQILIPTSSNSSEPLKVFLKEYKINEELPQHLFKKKDTTKKAPGKGKEKEY